MKNKTDFGHVFEPDPYYNDASATFGDRLVAARSEAGLSQKLLASKLGVKVQTVKAWEEDKNEPRANKLQMVSALLNVSMVWLMSGLGNGIDPPKNNTIIKENFLHDVLSELKVVRLDIERLKKNTESMERRIIKKIMAKTS